MSDADTRPGSPKGVRRRRISDEMDTYRNLISTPDTYRDGFDRKTVFGALFLGLVMMPGSIYLGLLAGQGMGPAAVWVTVILFVEVARRSLQELGRSEIYMLIYIATAMIVGGMAVMLPGGPCARLIWSQFLQNSEAARSIGLPNFPAWVAPPRGSSAVAERTFLHKDWIFPIVFVFVHTVVSRASWLSLGWVMFRQTSDRERLPFPMASVGAAGAMALADAGKKGESWRWTCFSTAAMIGVLFGAVYILVPAVTGAVFGKALSIIPIPFADWTTSTEPFLPATPTGMSCDLGLLLIGFVLPFWVVVGTFIGVILTLVANPILQHAGLLSTWQPGMDTITTTFANSIDFWLSAGIGLAIAVAIIGFVQTGRALVRGRKRRLAADAQEIARRKSRGGAAIWLAVLVYAAATCATIIFCTIFIKGFPWIYFVLLGFVVTPLISYVNARMIGVTGQFIGFPFLREATFIFSGYKGIDIWFAPIPLPNYGAQAQVFRAVELTGTKFRSIIKAEIMLVPLLFAFSFLYWGFIWKLAPIPSEAYPYATKMWHLQALQQCLWFSSTTEGGASAAMFSEAIKWKVILSGATFGLAGYGVLSIIGLPVTLIYGLIRSLGQMPHLLAPQMAGALLGRYYFRKKFGKERWLQYTPILVAGYSCGLGLIGMVGVAVALISKSVSQLVF